MTPNPQDSAVALEVERAKFEAFMSYSRRNGGVKKAAQLLNKFDDGTYINEHVQRHWWTWQKASACLRDDMQAIRHTLMTGLAHNHAIQALDRIVAVRASQSDGTSGGWISVDERLPAHEQEVICSGFEGNDPTKKRWQEFAVFHREGLFYNRETGDDYYPPTHWREMPALPAAPNQGENHVG